VRIEAADASGFGLDNLPYGVFSPTDGAPRVGTRLGDRVVDLSMLLGDSFGAGLFDVDSLNPFMATGYDRWAEVRTALREALRGEVPESAVHGVDDVVLSLPVAVADYVDFYASEHHATNLGRLFRPDNPTPLMPNWKHMPVGYHGRAASIVVSGTDVVRPWGQVRPPGSEAPAYAPSARLDIEAELGFVVGTGSPMGARVAAEEAERHIFGVVLFNDWSARDIQAWEYVPLGPNLGKSFASTISPWVVPLAALDAARVETPTQDPPVVEYLRMARPWGLDVEMEVAWNGEVVTRPPYREMYWSPAQMLAHQTANGAPSRTGDLFASGTVSGPRREQRGAFIELTWGGAEPVVVGGKERTFLLDGDEVVISATAPAPGGGRISFGECAGRVVAARG
jgi:fumarylacetoacetase